MHTVGAQWDLLFAHFAKRRTRLVLATRAAAEIDPVSLVGTPVLFKFKHHKKTWQPPQPTAGSSLGDCDTTDCGSRATVATAARGVALYDGWEQCVGETLVFHEVLDCLDFEALATVESGVFTEAAGAGKMTAGIERWLRQQQRLLVAETGEPLVKAFWVRLDPVDNVVAEVLATGDSA